MKKFFGGFTLGLALSFCFMAFAAQMEIMENPFKIFANGKEVKIEGYNIQGRSYFKLRDIGDVMGFAVDFIDDNIILNSYNTTIQEENITSDLIPDTTDIEDYTDYYEDDFVEEEIIEEEYDDYYEDTYDDYYEDTYDDYYED